MATRVIVAGGRDFNDITLMDKTVKELHQQGWLDSKPILICGMARGADNLGRVIWEDAYGLPVEPFPADWDKHGKAAGHIRNAQMAAVADKLIAFWDGQSRGTANMIETMQRLQKPVHIVRY